MRYRFKEYLCQQDLLCSHHDGCEAFFRLSVILINPNAGVCKAIRPLLGI